MTIATAEQALEALRHKRTGEILATKKLAGNTRLVYFADELVGLKLHQSLIAMYKPNGVTIDLRGQASPNGEGWFTKVTLDRISEFTPARISRGGGLTWLSDPEQGLLPYAHGAHLSTNGSWEMPIEPQVLAAVAGIVVKFPRKVKRYTNRIIKAWENWEQPFDCCTEALAVETIYDAAGTPLPSTHLLDHFERGQVVIPPEFARFMREQTANGFAYGEKLLNQGRDILLSDLQGLTALAVKRIAPEFPYPQVSRLKEGWT